MEGIMQNKHNMTLALVQTEIEEDVVQINIGWETSEITIWKCYHQCRRVGHNPRRSKLCIHISVLTPFNGTS